MLVERQIQPGESAHSMRVSESAKQSAISSELVNAITDRIWAMLLHELKIERERERFLARSVRKQGDW